MANIIKSKITFGVLLGLVVLGLGGYYMTHTSAGAAPSEGGSGGAPQAMPVPAALVELENLKIWKSFPGRMVAVDQVDLRPQVSGTISEIKFKDGQRVEAGDVLVVIDPKPYEAAVAQAQAALSAAKNEKSYTWKELKRAKDLVSSKALSQRVLSERSNAYSLAEASLDAAEATLVRAQINLDYAHVKAPISGRVGRTEITLGNLVEAGPNAPLLTTIVSDQGIYADFEVDEQTYLEFVRNTAKNRADENKIPVQVNPKSLSGLVYEGTIYSFDNQIDASSGTIRARALFPNTDGALLPGMFVTVKLGRATSEPKIVINERAIGTDQDRKFVYVINDQGMTEYREVKLGEAVNGQRVITSGLSEGETIVRDGIIRIRPGMPVAPQLEQEVQTQPPAQVQSE